MSLNESRVQFKEEIAVTGSGCFRETSYNESRVQFKEEITVTGSGCFRETAFLQSQVHHDQTVAISSTCCYKESHLSVSRVQFKDEALVTGSGFFREKVFVESEMRSFLDVDSVKRLFSRGTQISVSKAVESGTFFETSSPQAEQSEEISRGASFTFSGLMSADSADSTTVSRRPAASNFSRPSLASISISETGAEGLVAPDLLPRAGQHAEDAMTESEFQTDTESEADLLAISDRLNIGKISGFRLDNLSKNRAEVAVQTDLKYNSNVWRMLRLQEGNFEFDVRTMVKVIGADSFTQVIRQLRRVADASVQTLSTDDQQHQELRLSGQWRFEAEDGSVLLGDRGSVVISQSNVERYVPSQPPSLASSVAGDDLAEDQMMSMFPHHGSLHHSQHLQSQHQHHSINLLSPPTPTGGGQLLSPSIHLRPRPSGFGTGSYEPPSLQQHHMHYYQQQPQSLPTSAATAQQSMYGGSGVVTPQSARMTIGRHTRTGQYPSVEAFLSQKKH
uniref:FHA domain-containing protein n=1 Tax=Macrostomum lignano TaxID=282301 RepID=A0A1I8HLM2_9PLAT